MGVHYSKFSLFDGAIDVNTPEVLVYEPKNGKLHLVAAEYVIPAPACISGPRPVRQAAAHGSPPAVRARPEPLTVLMRFYELHVWAWRENPSGTFADWNPKVSCIQWGGTRAIAVARKDRLR